MQGADAPLGPTPVFPSPVALLPKVVSGLLRLGPSLIGSLDIRFVRISAAQVEHDLLTTLESIRAALGEFPLWQKGRGKGRAALGCISV
jgi:hypothetical protein